jgi:hypothetical protein
MGRAIGDEDLHSACPSTTPRRPPRQAWLGAKPAAITTITIISWLANAHRWSDFLIVGSVFSA